MVAITLLGSVWDTTSGTKTVTATPAVGDLVILAVGSSGSVADVAPTDDNPDGLGTYTFIGGRTRNSVDRIQFYIRDALIGSASSTIFTHAPGTTTGGGFAALKATGMTRTGAAASRQFASQSGSGATPNPSFASAVLTTNPVIGFLLNTNNPAGVTPRTGFTELVDTGYGTPTTGLEVMSIDSGETGTTMTWGSSVTNFCDAVMELDASSSSTPGYLKVWNGSAWVEKPVKVWNGSAWVQKPVKFWNGSAWTLA